MEFITTTGYYGTGSSAITDLLSEYEDLLYITDYEFRFIQDPNGISDLEFKLVENNHRHNSGHAIKMYKKMVSFLNGNRLLKKYNRFFGKSWIEESNKYINSLIDFSYIGYWHQDVYDKGKCFTLRKRAINKLLAMTIWKNKERNYNEMPKEITYCSYPSEKKFLYETKKYINSLFSRINTLNNRYVMVDQIVASSNVARYSRYFDTIKIFIVDRDPRDLYLLEKYIWKGSVIPTNNVETFCEWFILTRKHRLTENFEKNVFFLNFERLIYEYDDVVTEIEAFLDLKGKHIYPRNKFDPNISKLHTKLWIGYPKENDNIDYIKKCLKDYIYDKL